MPAIGPGRITALALFVAGLVVQRLLELRISSRHARALRARGAVEHGRAHFPMFVVLHTAFPIALVLEVIVGGARSGPAWPLWLALVAAAQGLRYSAMRALGTFWNVRVWVLPGAPPVFRGPYRWLRHPNYVAVAIELIAAPMVFGAWRTAVACTVLNAIAMAVRIPAEERALGLRA